MACFIPDTDKPTNTGIVTDTTGAIVPKPLVKATKTETDAVSTTTSNSAGEYRFPILNPGSYLLTAESDALSAQACSSPNSSGAGTLCDVEVRNLLGATVGRRNRHSKSVADGERENVTSYSKEYVENTPVDGGDITDVAFSIPGVRLNVGGGNTNFNASGSPFSSVLFTVNGADIVEPYNLNNKSGSRSYTLGANAVEQLPLLLA